MKIIEKMGLAILVIGFLGLIVPGLEAATIKVNCNKGDSVQSVLDSLTGPATIVVKGTCNENIVIKKDDVTIEGGTFIGPDPEQNTIQVHAARRVLITGATVRGANHGVRAYQSASLTLENSLFEANAQNGVVSTYGSSVNIDACTIQHNTLDGVSVTDNSALTLTNSTIAANGRTGVNATRASSARIGLSTTRVPGPNTITGNSGSGLSITRSAYASIENNTITGNSGNGVHIEGASAILTNNTIANNQGKGILVLSSGHARIGLNEVNSPGPNTIENNVYDGIMIANSADAFMFANTIGSNGLTTGRPGVSISRASGLLIGDNKIQGNGGHGVAVHMGTLYQGVGEFNFTAGPDIITQNGYSGILGWNNASLDIHHVTVTENTQNGIVLSFQSTLRISDSTVSGHISPYNGINVNRGSAVIFDHPSNISPAIVTNNTGWGVYCSDGESSLAGDTSGVTGNTGGQVSCSGF